MKYATAISPATMKATGRVKRPSRSSAPPTASRSPAMPASEPIGAVPPPGMIAAGNAINLAVPNCMKRKAAMIRRALSSCGAQLRHLATTFGAVMVHSSDCQDVLVSASPDRASSRASSRRSDHAANVPVGPRHRNSSTSRKSGASVLSVASVLNNSARSRCSPRTVDGNASMAPYSFSSRAALVRPIPAIPGYPSAESPTRARKSGIRAGSTPNFARTPAASRICFPRRSTCTTRSPRTHCARSLSGVQIQIFCTRSSREAICAAEARASSASSSIMGVAVWPMIELEADDALASAAQIASRDERVQKICIWTPDKDLAQCVRGDRVVQVDRRGKQIRDAAGVRAKFGVEPALIPDFLALVGDASDGYPGIGGIGRTRAARLLNEYGAIDAFPSTVLGEHRDLALLFRTLATLRTDAPLFRDVDELRWRGPTGTFAAWSERLEDARLLARSGEALTKTS